MRTHLILTLMVIGGAPSWAPAQQLSNRISGHTFILDKGSTPEACDPMIQPVLSKNDDGKTILSLSGRLVFFWTDHLATVDDGEGCTDRSELNRTIMDQQTVVTRETHRLCGVDSTGSQTETLTLKDGEITYKSSDLVSNKGRNWIISTARGASMSCKWHFSH